MSQPSLSTYKITLDATLLENLSAAEATWLLSGVLGVDLVLLFACLICISHLLYQKVFLFKLCF